MPEWIRELYAFAVKPTVAFYFRVPLEMAMKRINDARAGFKYYEAGMDLGLSDDPDESFRLFQGRILEEYEKMIPEFGLTVIDATLPIETQQQEMRQMVLAKLTQAKQLRVASVKESYGVRLPGLELDDLVGKLIVIEGHRRRRALDANPPAQGMAGAAGPCGAGYRIIALRTGGQRASSGPRKAIRSAASR